MTEAINASLGQRSRYGFGAVIVLWLAAAIFAALGEWQLERGEQRRRMESDARDALAMAPLDLRQSPVYERDAWRQAVAEGTYDPTQQFYLVGRQHQGQSGYHVITALRLTGTRRYVLVNRGWMPATERAAPVPPGKVQVRGVLRPPELPALRLVEPGGMTRPFLDPVAYAHATDRSVAPLLLVAENGGVDLAPVAAQVEAKQAKHLGYALQWFVFAVVALVSSVIILVRRVRHGA